MSIFEQVKHRLADCSNFAKGNTLTCISTREDRMQRFALSVLAAGVFMAAGDASFAQGTLQTLNVMKIDVIKVASGFRATKIIGETVVNDANETVGKVDDLIIAPDGPDGKVPVLILSVGGFLGVGNKLVALPFDSVKIQDKKLLLTGANKDALKNLPEFKYAKD